MVRFAKVAVALTSTVMCSEPMAMALTSRLLEESKIASLRAGIRPAEGAISSELVLA